jgi:hypothetical protein
MKLSFGDFRIAGNQMITPNFQVEWLTVSKGMNQYEF